MLLVPAVLAAQQAGPARGGGMFVPDSLRNIRVLPRTMTPVEVVATMRNITGALGVRCPYCHVGQEGQPLSQFDFASDEKPTKVAARVMIEMVQSINGQHLTRLERRETPDVEVTCATCHRGVAVPRPLPDVLLAAVTAGGADSATRAYRALRERYYGRSAYDFGEGTLTVVAGRLARERRFDDAAAMARLNVEFFPRSGGVQAGLGDVLRMRGDTAGAVAAYRQALQVDPSETGARARLRELGVQP
jgi:hypothetical protein